MNYRNAIKILPYFSLRVLVANSAKCPSFVMQKVLLRLKDKFGDKARRADYPLYF